MTIVTPQAVTVTPIIGVPSTKPPREVLDALEAGVVQVKRRIAIFESDGETPWIPDLTDDSEFNRLVGGNINVDYSSGERRKLDLILDNRDGLLRQNPIGGLWYDKIIKIFRGVSYQGKAITPHAAIIEAPTDSDGYKFAAFLSSIGFRKTVYLPNATTTSELYGYSFIFVFTGNVATTKATLLSQLRTAGKHIVTVGTGSDHTLIPLYSASTSPASVVTTNLIAAPRPSSGYITGWSSLNSSGAFTTANPYSANITASASSPASVIVEVENVGTGSITLTAYGAGTIDALFAGANASTPSPTPVTLAPGEKREIRWQGTLGSNVNGFRILFNVTSGAFADVRLHKALATTSTYNEEFFDGATPDTPGRDYAWTGAAGTSTSTRTATLYQWGISPAAGDNPAKGAFVTQAVGVSDAGMRPTALATGAVAIAVYPAIPGNNTITAAIHRATNGAYWFDLHTPLYDTSETKKLTRAVLNFMRNYNSEVIWEVQQGEFMIDTISADHFPNLVKITGRDYTKKLILSKLKNSLVFEAGTSLATIISALATNGGADPTKFQIGIGTETITSDMAFERGTDRWSIIKSACDAYGYEVYFSPNGSFVVRKFRDPHTSPSFWTFKTGYEDNPDGANLVSYSRSTSDSRIHNYIIVTSSPSDGAETLPYYGEAKNTNPDSPTRIARLGERTDVIETNWLGSDAECVAMAKARLKISALESYDINYSAIYYPWMEVGEIVDILDPDRIESDPTRFLMDTISYPIDLGPMSATGKRITYVGDSG